VGLGLRFWKPLGLNILKEIMRTVFLVLAIIMVRSIAYVSTWFFCFCFLLFFYFSCDRIRPNLFWRKRGGKGEPEREGEGGRGREREGEGGRGRCR